MPFVLNLFDQCRSAVIYLSLKSASKQLVLTSWNWLPCDSLSVLHTEACSLSLVQQFLAVAYIAILDSNLRQAAITGPKRDSAAASSSSPAVSAPGG